ncbi:PHP domain-containing protein [Clostridium sediminicola]|uniref:PHP domain-containing protein n=1 Tax=Clostridium sediminicola TaxID=3114879 RepID=UPI0031F1D5AD
MIKKGDFHLHTNASDGKLSPTEVVKLAKTEGLDIIAITDHDNTNGLEEGLLASKNQDIKIIPGIELTTTYNNESVHIVGYFRDTSYDTKDFQDFLKDLQNRRVTRGKEITNRLKKFFNIEISFEKILKETNGLIARPHLARAIIDAGYDFSWDYIFDNIISNDSPAYVPNKKIEVSDGISLLKNLGAFVSLAHPTLLKKTPVRNLLEMGFDGIEGIYPLNKKNEETKFRLLAKEFGILLTAGSDYHGLDKNDNKHGFIGCCPLIGDDLTKFLKVLGTVHK